MRDHIHLLYVLIRYVREKRRRSRLICVDAAPSPMGGHSARHSRRWCGRFVAVLLPVPVRDFLQTRCICSSISPCRHAPAKEHRQHLGMSRFITTCSCLNPAWHADDLPMDPLPNLLPIDEVVAAVLRGRPGSTPTYSLWCDRSRALSVVLLMCVRACRCTAAARPRTG